MPFINADLLADQFARAVAGPTPTEDVTYAIINPHTGQILDDNQRIPITDFGDSANWFFDPFTGKVLDHS